MAYELTMPSGKKITLEKLISVWLRSIEHRVHQLYVARGRLDNEIYDSQYNDFGNPRKYSNPYSISLAEAEEEYENAVKKFCEGGEEIAPQRLYPSLELAKAFADSLYEKDNSKNFIIKTEKRGELEYLLVTDGNEYTAVIDISVKINDDSKRDILDVEKFIDGQKFILQSFIPDDDKDIFPLFKKELQELLSQE